MMFSGNWTLFTDEGEMSSRTEHHFMGKVTVVLGLITALFYH